MSSLTITMRNGASPAVRNIVDTIRSPEALIKGGLALRDSISSNFAKLPPNKNFPGQTTGFWERAAKSMTAPAIEGANTVLVSITRAGVRYQYLGGTILPRNAKMLTIPAREEAYGKTARQFPNLQIARLGIGPSGMPILALVERESQEIDYKRKRGKKRIIGDITVRVRGALAVQRGTITGGLVMYWLVNSVSKGPNPEVLPTEVVMRGAFAGGIRAFVNGTLGRKAITSEDLN
jgi:hypothetical protein